MSGNARYLGDGLYASFDGYHIWLRTGSHLESEATNQVALEPDVFAALVKYQSDLGKIVRPATEADWQAFGKEET